MTFIPVFALWNSGNITVVLTTHHPHEKLFSCSTSSRAALDLQATQDGRSRRRIYICIGH